MNTDKNKPQGFIDFQKRLENNTRDKGTETANIDCEECQSKIWLVGPTLTSMHVFVYPDPPTYTTKALCFNCMNEALKKHGGKQIRETLN